LTIFFFKLKLIFPYSSSEVCRKCHKEFETSEDLQVHMKIHDQEKPSKPLEKCDKCDKQFYSKGSLKAHINNAHNNIKFTCDLCHVSFAFATGLQRHKKKLHEGIRYHFQCSKCEKGYQTYSNLEWHMKTQHQGLKLKCEFCVSYFSHKISLVRHMESKHKSKKPKKLDLVRVDEGDELFQCDFCDQDFVKEQNLFIHIGHAHPECSEKTCEQCGQKCRSPSELKKHVAAVHEKSMIWCSQCDKDISQAYYGRHMKTVHEGLKRTCEFCHQGFSIYNLKKHSEICRRRRNRNKVKVEEDDFEVEKICPFCKKIFASNEMKTHVQMHLDEMCDDDKLSYGSKNQVFWRPWDSNTDKVCDEDRIDAFGKLKKEIKEEQMDFQSKRFQPRIRLQKLSGSEITVKSNQNKKFTKESKEDPIDFQSERFQPKVRLQKLSGSEIKVLSALVMFEGPGFKRPW